MNMKNLNVCGVYKLINIINNNYYIGSSYNIKIRIRKHFELLKRNSHHSIHFQNAYNKYGKDVFLIELLEICNKNNILNVEQKYLDEIKNWNNVYNVSRIASGCNYNLSTHPNQEKIRLKISNANRGKHTKPFYINDIRYETLKDAADKFCVDIKAISSKLKNWKNKNWYYENIPKIGEYDFSKHSIYFYKPVNRKKYYCSCGCGKEIGEYAKYHKDCRRLHQKPTHKLISVIINDIEYVSPKEASRILKIEYATLLWRIKSNTLTFKDYYYKNSPKDISKLTTIDDINRKISEKNKGNKGLNNIKPFIIDDIKYLSLGDASKKLNIKKQLIWNRLKSKNFNNYQYLN